MTLWFRGRVGIVGHAHHATATPRHGTRASVPLIVSSTLCPCGKAGLERYGSRDHDVRKTRFQDYIDEICDGLSARGIFGYPSYVHLLTLG